MAELQIEKTPDWVDPVIVAPVAMKRTSQIRDTNGATGPADKPQHDVFTKGTSYSKPHDYLDDALNGAERLLKYASETGIDIDAATRNSILQARTASSNGWNEETAANLLTALTKLTARVKPVTSESLEWSKKFTNRALWGYYTAVALLALVIGTFSVAIFVASALSSAIRTGIATGDELAVKLQTARSHVISMSRRFRK